MTKEQVLNMLFTQKPLEKPSVSLSVATESSDTSVFTVLLPSLFWSLCQFSESRVFKRFTKFSLNSDAPLLLVLTFILSCLRKLNIPFLQ